MVVINEDAKLTIAAPVVSGSAVLDLNFGLDIIDFSADMDSINQLSKVEFQSWDSKKLSLVKSSSTCLLYTSPSPRDRGCSRMPSSA